MRQGLFWGSAFVALSVAGALVAYLFAPAANTIRGYVFDASGHPTMGAVVTLQPETPGSAAPAPVRTDGYGWFVVPELPEGRFAVSARGADGATASVPAVARGASVIVRLAPAPR